MISHSKAKKPAHFRLRAFCILAPRPGLELGICGLTEIQAAQKVNIFNGLYQKKRFV